MPVPLVLLPGMNCSPRLWDGVLRDLGAGRSGGRARPVVVPEIDRPTLGEQVESLLDRLPPRFAIGGLSLGAIVAMAVHRRAPERVAGLFLVATNAQPPTEAQRSAWAAQLDSLAGGASPRDLQEELLPLLIGADPAPDLATRTLALADAVDGSTLRAQLELQLDPRRRTTGARRSNGSLHRGRGSGGPPLPTRTAQRDPRTGRRIGASRRPGRSAPGGVVAPAPIGRSGCGVATAR